MIVDSSALVAIVLRETGYVAILETLAGDAEIRIGAPTAVETGIVLGRRLNLENSEWLVRLCAQLAIEVVPFGEAHWRSAVAAYQRFGRGHHPAQLNFGDCLTYAFARVADEPILCVGADFSLTDVTVVPLPEK